MKLSKKRFLIIQIYLLIITIMLQQNCVSISAKSLDGNNSPVKAAVLLYNEQDAFISLLKQQFEEIQKKNEGKVEFVYYDAVNNQETQNRTIDKILNDKTADIIMLNLVNPENARSVVNKIKEYNIPVVLFNREPKNMNDIKSYNNAYYVGSNEVQAGLLQGKIIAELWEKNKKIIDRNRDNVLQYIMIMGSIDSKEANIRTKYSVYSITEEGIKTDELALTVCNWNRETAKQNFGSLLLSNINKLEAVISNNDEMAVGAIEALQVFGYNKGVNSKTIPVVGIDAIPAAQELINKGEMAGTVYQQYPQIAETCYLIGMNLVNRKPPLEGIEYKFDDSGVAVRVPYVRYQG